MIRTVEISIDGAKYAISQFPARHALRIQAKLIKTLGPFLYEISEDKKKALTLLSQTIKEDDLVNLATELLSCTRKDGIELTPSIIDLEFAGGLGTLYKVALQVIEVNYENFFEALAIGKGRNSPEPASHPSTASAKK